MRCDVSVELSVGRSATSSIQNGRVSCAAPTVVRCAVRYDVLVGDEQTPEGCREKTPVGVLGNLSVGRSAMADYYIETGCELYVPPGCR